jgi:hypothetical protein
LLAAAGATCVSGLANLAGEGDAGDGLYPGDVVVDEDLTAGIPQLTTGQRSEGQDSDLRIERYMMTLLRYKMLWTRRKVMDKLQENQNFLPFSKSFMNSIFLGKLLQIFCHGLEISKSGYKHCFSCRGKFFYKGKFEAK